MADKGERLQALYCAVPSYSIKRLKANMQQGAEPSKGRELMMMVGGWMKMKRIAL
jgi:hypothetical protein